MNTQRIKAVLALALMAASFAAATVWHPSSKLADTRPRVDLELMFPKRLGEWVVDERMPVQLVSPDTQAMLNKIYNQTLSRTYVNAAGDRIMLSVAYGGDQSDATRAHRPEVCYPAQGFQILTGTVGQLAMPGHFIPVRQLVASLGSRNEPITYWITVGDRVAVSGTQQKLAQLAYTTKGVVPDGMLVRVSSIDNNNTKAFAMHQQFVSALAAGMAPSNRAQVMGKAGA